MRHRVQRHSLGLKKEHREQVVAQLAAQLIEHGRIQTTLAKAKAVRPYVEKVITLAVRAKKSSDEARGIALRRLAVSRLRSEEMAKVLFTEKVDQFLNRSGGYTRIYKLIKRRGDGADMAIIELIAADDEGYNSKRKSAKKKPAAKAKKTEATPAAVEAVAEEAPVAVAEAESVASIEEPEAVEDFGDIDPNMDIPEEDSDEEENKA